MLGLGGTRKSFDSGTTFKFVKLPCQQKSFQWPAVRPKKGIVTVEQVEWADEKTQLRIVVVMES